MRVEGLLEETESRWVDVGGPVHYREWPGPAEGPTFVCVHGLGGSLINWLDVAPSLARRGRVIALDLAGFGLTPPDGRGAGVGANRRLLDGFLTALSLPPVVLLGSSMGGMISMIQAAHAPGTVRSLVLAGAVFPRGGLAVSAQPTPAVAAAFALYGSQRLGPRFVRYRARRLGPEKLVHTTLELCTSDPASIDPRLVEALIELARRRAGFDYAVESFLEAARSIYRAQLTPKRYRTVLRAVPHRALVIHGTKDRLVRVAWAREAVRNHPDRELVEFDDLGHLPMMEAPDRFLAAVEGWLDRSADVTVELD